MRANYEYHPVVPGAFVHWHDERGLVERLRVSFDG